MISPEPTVASSTNDPDPLAKPQRRSFAPNQRRRRGGAGGRSSDPGPSSGRRDPQGDKSRNYFEGDKSRNYFEERVRKIGGPTFDLPELDTSEKKFGSKNKLYVGNLGVVSEKDLAKLFEPYGEVGEVFINKEKHFGFVKMDYHANAVKAKRELDGKSFQNKSIKVRMSPSLNAIKIKNLAPNVTNELLHYAFSIFGEVERAIVFCDEKAKSTGEGVVEFMKRGCATYALRKCQEECYFLTAALTPIVVEPYEILEDPDGLSEKLMNKKSPDYMADREMGPRFAFRGSFEEKYGTKWKALYDLQRQKENSLKKEFELEREKLAAQMEYEKYEHETEVLREQLRAREMDKNRQKREWELKERLAQEEKQRYEDAFRRRQESMLLRQQDENRMMEESSLFAQAHNLDSILDQQESAFAISSYSDKQFTSPYDVQESKQEPDDEGGRWVAAYATGDAVYTTKRARRF